MQHANRTSLFMRERSKGYNRRRRRSKSLSILACDGGSLLRVLISGRSPLEDLHRLFPSIPADEFPLNVFTCALSKEILLQGKMFVSQNWICFYSNIFGYETKVTIETKTIVALGRERTAFVVPNAISIQIPNKRFFFCSFLSRETVFRLLSRTWQAAIRDENSCHSDDGANNHKTSNFDEIDCNHNARKTSVSKLKIEPRAIYSDSDLDLIRFSTPIFERTNRPMYPAIFTTTNGIPRLKSYPTISLKVQPKFQLCKWNTEADLTDLKMSRDKRAAEFLRRRHNWPMLQDNKHLNANESYKSSVTRSIKFASHYASKKLNIFVHRLVHTSIYFFFSIIIIILGIMTLFLLYKINNLSQTFAEKNVSHSTLCKSPDLKLSISEESPFRGKLERVNDILSTNLKAVYKVQDSLRKLKKNLDQ